MTEKMTERQVGFELEYANVALPEVAGIVEELYGGHRNRINEAEIEVTNTKFGTFRLELDAEPVKKLVALAEDSSAVASAPKLLQQILADVAGQVSEAASKLGSMLAPFEIVTPPIPVSKISELDVLCNRLRQEQVQDTTDAFFYAFGLHINPEIKSDDPQEILSYIKAFGLLFPYLRREHEMDWTRRLSGYSEPYPAEYVELICESQYRPNLEELIRDYHRHNPDRNKALDMLPLFAHLDERLTRSLYGEEEKINPRPTFHYRLPNSEVGDPEWSFEKEWNRWLIVERAATDEQALEKLVSVWKDHMQKEKTYRLNVDGTLHSDLEGIVEQLSPQGD